RRGRRLRRRRQPGDDLPRLPKHYSRDDGHDDDARGSSGPRRAEHVRPRLHALPELPHRRARARECDPLHAGSRVRRGQAAGRQIAGAYPQGARRCRHSDRFAHRPYAAHDRDVRRVPDPGAHGRGSDEDPRGRARDPGRGLLHARIRGCTGKDRGGHLEAARDPDDRHRRGRRHRRPDPALLRPARRVHRLQAEVHQALREPDRGRDRGPEGLRCRRACRHVPGRRPQLRRRRQGVRKIPRTGRKAEARVASQTLTDQAYTHLEELIVTLQLPPGSAVSEGMLSRQLGIGRTPIREALQRLARESLVVILPRRGVMVSEINVRTQLRLLEVRREVERLVARSAARRATPQEREAMSDLARHFLATVKSNDDRSFMRADREFNELLLAAAKNEFAAGAMRLMQSLSRRFWYQHYKEAADLPETARLHADIARAIAKGDEDAAAGATDRLLDKIRSFTRATVSADA